ncbi:MAG TPA: 30S ribosome-binding factor RbfA [Steroidobacteraceae bacterium]|nr:30S ribosome-binding factor RbfA [Steroidobacteraceae bacterium]
MAKDNPRARRLGEQIQRELTELLRREVKDGRIGNITVTAVSVGGDLRTARVYYLVFGKEGPDQKVQRGLESAAGFLRNALSRSLMIRYTPTLSFELDTSIEHGVRLTQLIDSVNKPRVSTPAASPVGDANDTGETHDSGDPHESGGAEDEGHVVDEGDYSPDKTD